MVNSIQALFLGILQGLTEFLPISSSGHLYLGRQMFGLNEAGLLLDTMLHIGTLFAVLVFYRREFIGICRNPFGKLTWLLIAGTIPAVIVGFAFKDYFDSLSKSGVTVGWEFLITGCFLWFADSIKKGRKQMEDLTFKDAVFIGTFQAAAIFPAISRSGMTMAAALMRKLDRETAAYFSFLLSTPAIAGAILLQSMDILKGEGEAISPGALAMGIIASAAVGYAAVKWMIGYLKKHSLKAFAVYVWILGLFIVAMQYSGKF
ncbi:undecaprenyl-diphosphate phosphatase [Bacillus testis]|uniref:undecaprenyl-diphosphate phosphatase n=1 Tax=Bacillus testis TaxID=1622072 RepID=UPI00067F4D2D|nr:undecaprenyl-diphosphate phosphatase [Bacillus testis]